MIGIDPGFGGGVAWWKNEKMVAHTMPGNPHELADLLLEARSATTWPTDPHAFVEKVHAMPRQGVSSTFKFGMQYGTILGILAAYEIPYTLVSPSVWQRKLGCLTKGDKNVTKHRALELFPYLKITHAIADATLICEYGRRIHS